MWASVLPSKGAGDIAVTPGSLRSETRTALKPLLERLSQQATDEFIGGDPLVQARRVVPVFSSLLSGTTTRALYRVVLEDANNLEAMLNEESLRAAAPVAVLESGYSRSVGSWAVADDDYGVQEVAPLTPRMTAREDMAEDELRELLAGALGADRGTVNTSDEKVRSLAQASSTTTSRRKTQLKSPRFRSWLATG